MGLLYNSGGGGEGGTVGHDPQNKDFSNFFVYKSKNAPKT